METLEIKQKTKMKWHFITLKKYWNQWLLYNWLGKYVEQEIHFYSKYDNYDYDKKIMVHRMLNFSLVYYFNYGCWIELVY